eukprot:gnl/MRDRNA2_/MRDRNA2_121515_c0_seq1.p1 gnl/MRDRNA2_/MRDRNA2_121515_c0~~gnl/MRDRNA2_/MRDRNA2_121515_c0_seq1.p1  ORF type:complete len:160 (-),score=10.15 gnl/MRDRNA2_/MRDRNA2_121515_c0_seq1:78-557(-)
MARITFRTLLLQALFGSLIAHTSLRSSTAQHLSFTKVASVNATGYNVGGNLTKKCSGTTLKVGKDLWAGCSSAITHAVSNFPCMGLTVSGPDLYCADDKACLSPCYPSEFSGYSPYDTAKCSEFACDVVKAKAPGNCVSTDSGYLQYCDSDLGQCAPCR